MKLKLSLLSFLMSAAMLLTACGSSSDSTESSGDSTAASASETDSSAAPSEGSEENYFKGEGFRVDGTKLIDGKGNEFVMRGVNHSHSWFRDYDETALTAISATGANTVRIVLSDGEQWTRDTIPGIQRLIDKCRELGLIAVLEVHDATGKESKDDLDKAVDFWIKMKKSLIGNEDYAIVNIANEWMGSWGSDAWAEAYIDVIPKLRAEGIKNTIMVDSPGWGQYGQAVADRGKDVFEADPDRNTMFSVHMYGTAGKNPTTIENNLKGATDNSLCIIVGEFGHNHSDGDVDEAYIMQYCRENNIGWLGWSWKGNSSDVGYLDLTEDWEGTKLSPDWGEVLINSENGIKATSKKCTVFD